jgi:hypothetical protein
MSGLFLRIVILRNPALLEQYAARLARLPLTG